LRGPGSCLFPITELGEYPGFQERPDQRHHALVFDPGPHPIEEGRMPDLVEAGRDIGLQNPVIVPGSGCQMVDLGDRVMGTPVRAEPVRARQEVRLENGLEHRL
jgi:hypothetical protein